MNNKAKQDHTGFYMVSTTISSMLDTSIRVVMTTHNMMRNIAYNKAVLGRDLTCYDDSCADDQIVLLDMARHYRLVEAFLVLWAYDVQDICAISSWKCFSRQKKFYFLLSRTPSNILKL